MTYIKSTDAIRAKARSFRSVDAMIAVFMEETFGPGKDIYSDHERLQKLEIEAINALQFDAGDTAPQNMRFLDDLVEIVCGRHVGDEPDVYASKHTQTEFENRFSKLSFDNDPAPAPAL
ncbi:hypothetical protein ACFOY8_14220 [Thalassospira xianhensis]|uniref:Uncharacterized protein n=1 Tax=Thalassospira xianhensis MCCC 1A02616 TaxID=1177929 RepID=A0A367UHP6_9PROT|nr:hypothetical protein [Thalassospira xianhensis]RCK07689.1 hypothetical protein TH5_01045 [Thalassospira xianhensis MCCC 1A02616]